MRSAVAFLLGSMVAVSVVPAERHPAAQQRQDAFDVVSVKPMGDAPAERLAAYGRGCDGSFPQVENNRFRVTTTVYALITWAYGYNDRGGCSFTSNGNLITGGPSWVGVERFEVQAVLPDGAPSYTLTQFLDGQTPRLEAMLRTLLAERFKLQVRRETKDASVYALVPGRGGAKVPTAKGDDPVMFNVSPDPGGGNALRLRVSNVTMSRIALMVGIVVRRPVVDGTGMTGLYTFDLLFAPPNANPADTSAPSLTTAFQEQLGLRLEDARRPVEGVVIESIERPTDN
jgi:uncharacterized protein (TIGR03435 family)